MRYLLAAAILLVMQPASAATCGSILNPILVIATPVVFALYDPGAKNATTANGSVTVTCTVTLGATLPSFTIALSPSTTGTYTPRQLQFGSARLGYNIYTSNSYATIWGDGSTPTQTQSYSSSNGLAAVPFTAFGAIATHQFATPGLYTDSITVTVTY